MNSSLWNHTIGYGMTGPRLDYLSDDQNCRAERMRIARMLWKGQHRCAFLEEGRSQFHFPPSKVNGQTRIPYITLNVLRLVTTTVTDLLLGEEPLLRVEEETGQKLIDDLAQRCDLHRVFYDAAKEASWSAEATVEISRYDGEVYVSNIAPGELYPVGTPNADGQYSAYKRFATAPSADGKKNLLLETTYLAGSITRACFELDGSKKKSNVELSQWPTKRADGGDLLPQEATGIDWNTIVWMANELDEGRPTSDYDGLIELQDELNAKQTQIARVIEKHADPKAIVPSSMVDPNTGTINWRDGLMFTSDMAQKPEYLVWNAELAHAIADRDFTLNALCIAAELSPVLLGIKSGATPDAARKLRLEATKSLARRDRKAAFVKPFLRTALETAMKMDRAGRLVLVAAGKPSVELADGLPTDEIDQSTAIANYRAAGVMSVAAGVEARVRDPIAAAKEIERLAEEKSRTAAEATPSILLGSEDETATGRSGEAATDEEGVAA